VGQGGYYVDGEEEEEESFLRIDFFAERKWLVESLEAMDPLLGVFVLLKRTLRTRRSFFCESVFFRERG
jgi:hypothetical protein